MVVCIVTDPFMASCKAGFVMHQHDCVSVLHVIDLRPSRRDRRQVGAYPAAGISLPLSISTSNDDSNVIDRAR